MGVSLTGSRGMSMTALRRLLLALAVLLALLVYAYGPPATPALRSAARSECNSAVDGSFRHYRLQWDVGWRPHWTCWDLRDPGRDPVDLGWWVSPW